MSLSSRILTIAALASLSTLLAAYSVSAQQRPAVQGDFNGTLGPLQVKLHITAAADGKLSATLDVPAQGASGIPVVDVRVEGQTFTFGVPAVGGTFKGTIEDNGAKLAGTWTQGASTPLTFTKDTFVAASKPSAIDGFWLGTLGPAGQAIRVQITVKSDQGGKEYCTFDSIDQNGFGVACENVVFSGSDLSFELSIVRGRFTGKLSADGKTIDGTWTQGAPTPLKFERQAAPIGPTAPKPVAFNPTLALVRAAEMETVLARDFEKALKSGSLSPETAAGISIGVVRDGDRRIFTFGTAKVDSLFEIGFDHKDVHGSAPRANGSARRSHGCSIREPGLLA